MKTRQDIEKRLQALYDYNAADSYSNSRSSLMIRTRIKELEWVLEKSDGYFPKD